MRIGVNTLFMIPGEVGGAETYLRETLKAMARQAPGHELILFTNTENDPVLRGDLGSFPQVRFVPLQFRAMNRFSRILREQIQLPGAVRQARADVLWSPGYTAPFLAPCPQVTSILDMQYKSHPEDLTPLARLTTAILVSCAARRSRRLLAISEFSKTEIVRYTGVPLGKVDVTPLAADETPGPADDLAAARARVAALTGSTAPYLLLVSNTYPHKNVATAIEAFGRLPESFPHHLVLVGRPRLGEETVQAAMARLPDPARFHRLDWVKREDVVFLYQAADLLVHPSLYEGFGLPVLEAMRAGVPVVTGRFGSIPEVGGDACVYVDSRSAAALAAGLSEVLSWDPRTRATRVEQGVRRAAGFTWTRTAAQTLASLEHAAAGCPSCVHPGSRPD